jgi:hypothetical protein
VYIFVDFLFKGYLAYIQSAVEKHLKKVKKLSYAKLQEISYPGPKDNVGLPLSFMNQKHQLLFKLVSAAIKIWIDSFKNKVIPSRPNGPGN